MRGGRQWTRPVHRCQLDVATTVVLVVVAVQCRGSVIEINHCCQRCCRQQRHNGCKATDYNPCSDQTCQAEHRQNLPKRQPSSCVTLQSNGPADTTPWQWLASRWQSTACSVQQHVAQRRAVVTALVRPHLCLLLWHGHTAQPDTSNDPVWLAA